jgi:hypothetical protein
MKSSLVCSVRMHSCIVFVLLAAIANPAVADSYFIRADGGSASQCTGQADQPYPGSGSNQDCAWNHPFVALPPGGPARIQGGDTLHIQSASYMMGYGAPAAKLPPKLVLGMPHDPDPQWTITGSTDPNPWPGP